LKDDAGFMARALALARRGAGETNPNPLVGCVLVKGGRVVGEGWHRRAGGPHAEVEALRAAGPAARGATLYVNLEPCAHQGRTPPCAPTVAASGVRRVVAAILDPNPAVNGRGLRELRRAGLAVTVGVGAKEARALNRRFLTAAAGTRPFVLLKAGITLDGRIATAGRASKWITSPRQRRLARRLRRLHDAVAVGVGTVLADDPTLMPMPEVQRRFVRIVFDSNLRLPPDSRLARSAMRWPVWALTTTPHSARAAALEARGVAILPVKGKGPHVPVPAALRALRRLGIWSLMVEGGSELLGSFLAARAFDQVALFRAPMILGGRGSLGAFGGPDPTGLARAPRLAAAEDPLIPSDGLVELWRPAGAARKGKR
jgi:diaminohydroxyphosphoribosylaminopyrimidine deaminase / 5-amino-6-(5-phosphoribosylamino)uracil reductase